MHHLSTYGMVVKTPENQIIRSKVHCLAFGGDTLGVFEFSSAAYHSSSLGCRICYTRGVHPDNRSHGMYFPDSKAPLRTRQDYLDADPDFGFLGRIILTQLDVFGGPQSLILTSCILLAVVSHLSYIRYDGIEVEKYPFHISRQRLTEIGKKIDETRQFITVTF
ncbi:hypothetical protein, partial, partial [Parasitella parasitica]